MAPYSTSPIFQNIITKPLTKDNQILKTVTFVIELSVSSYNFLVDLFLRLCNNYNIK